MSYRHTIAKTIEQTRKRFFLLALLQLKSAKQHITSALCSRVHNILLHFLNLQIFKLFSRHDDRTN